MKRFLGTLLALGAMALMTVGVQAATYSVTGASVSDADTDGNVALSVQVTPDTESGETEAMVNGYVIALTYDSEQVTPVVIDADADSVYATASDSFNDGVLVSDTVTNSEGDTTLVIAWASATPVTVSEATAMADVEFNVSDATADSTVEVAVIEATSDGTELATNYSVSYGEISLTDILYGDVDLNGKINSTDALYVTQYALGNRDLTTDQFESADVDGNDKLNSTDALHIIQKALGTRDSFLVEE